MSWVAKRLSRKTQATCSCGHRALFLKPRSHWRFVSRRDHPLCRRCWRAMKSREKARQMAAARALRRNPAPGVFALI